MNALAPAVVARAAKMHANATKTTTSETAGSASSASGAYSAITRSRAS